MSAEGDTVIVENISAPADEPSVAWSAIIAGALAAASISFLLLILGPALGMPRVSPWSQDTTLGMTTMTAIWLIIMQWLSSGVGGYMAGRLRHKWRNLHDDEVYFRDTAHGFLVWALSTLVAATLLVSASVEAVHIGMHTPPPAVPAPPPPPPPPAPAAQPLPPPAAVGQPPAPPVKPARPHPPGIDPVIDREINDLLRSDNPANNGAVTSDERRAMAESLSHGFHHGGLSDTDKAVLINVMTKYTDLDNGEVLRRVDEVNAKFEARKEKKNKRAQQAEIAVRHASLFVFLSLLIGAFIASAAAALGGIHRDRY